MNVYLEAAQWLAKRPALYSLYRIGCCRAVQSVHECEEFPTDLFEPQVPNVAAWYFGWEDGIYQQGELPPDETRSRRLTALCLAAAMHETGDL